MGRKATKTKQKIYVMEKRGLFPLNKMDIESNKSLFVFLAIEKLKANAEMLLDNL